VSGPRGERPKRSRDGIEDLSAEDVERRILGLESDATKSRLATAREKAAAAAAQEAEAAEARAAAAAARAAAPSGWDDPAGVTDAADAAPTVVVPTPAIEELAIAVATEPAPGKVRRLSRDAPRVTRRRLLTRDTSTIIAGGLLALAFGRFLLGPAGLISPTPTVDSSQVAVIGSDEPLPFYSGGVGPTLGGLVDPSLGLEATPTLIPVITLPPGATPAPTPKATPRPTAPPTGAPALVVSTAPCRTCPPHCPSIAWTAPSTRRPASSSGRSRAS